MQPNSESLGAQVAMNGPRVARSRQVALACSPSFDLSRVPFSRRGSRLAFGRLTEQRAAELGKKPGLFLRTVAGGVAMEHREIFRVEALVGNKTVAARETASPALISLAHGKGKVEAAFAGESRLILRGSGLGLRLSGDGGWYATLRPAGPGLWELNLLAHRIQLMLKLRSGSIRIDAPWDKDACTHVRLDLHPDESGAWELEIEEFRAAWKQPSDEISLEDAAASAAGDFTTWLGRTLPAPQALARARELSAYINWSSLVSPRGLLQREAMLMSKNWMINVWSWDHCFNAIALARRQASLAWDQWAVMFDFQHSSGVLPDCVNDAEIIWNFTKPPVHGWALREMRAQGFKPTRSQMIQARRWLAAWTDWWCKHRDDDADGLPAYNHGNDSGWDNASVMGSGPPVEGADLAAFLIIQMDVLAGLCEELGQGREGTRWRCRADTLCEKLIDHSWRGDQFVCPRSGDHHVAEGDSLVPFMPMLLGARLDSEMRRALVRGVRRFVTPHGVASENPDSPLYQPDGYWRGPVWAPSTYLIVCGLRACGADHLAARVARAFCRTCAHSGFAENFNALTGAGLRDRAYTWTASVFQILAEGIRSR